MSPEHNDTTFDYIEYTIKYIANALYNQVPENEIVSALQKTKITDIELFYIFQAGKLLFQDRKNAPSKRTLIKRIK